ncbi:ParB-like nuclease domain-containing protein [Candidatus Woesearchaeota archaeon]|nr:ParB-like nuclease domain-containing protein [Candidatus Woesearchaeota archaeon]
MAFEIPFWNRKDGFYDLTPNEVINNPDNFKEEYSRTMKADMTYPIDIMKNNGRWLILDGLHRLVKSKILGYSKVKVRKIPRSEVPNIEKQGRFKKPI